IYVVLSVILLASCDLNQEVDLNLPEYEPQLVVESYLQPGQPYVLTLLESVGFFEEIQVRYERDAVVTITHEGETIELEPLEIPLNSVFPPGFVDTALLNRLRPILGDAAYFYVNTTATVPESFNTNFDLSVTTTDGRVLTATTVIPPRIAIDTVEWKFNDDSLAFVLTKFTDDPNQQNFYRRVLENVVVDSIDDGNGNIELQSRIDEELDFTINDDIVNGEQVTFGTNFDYRLGDTVINRIYHITPEFYRFSETRDAAITASLSPFAPPAVVTTNIEGGIGIFTGFVFDERTTVVGE
ncbi:MAG: DUF4249 domain-containing protein, partial [Bacteroidota bacterium]